MNDGVLLWATTDPALERTAAAYREMAPSSLLGMFRETDWRKGNLQLIRFTLSGAGFKPACNTPGRGKSLPK